MDIQKLKKQLDYLEETKQLIKEQLVAKGQPVDDNTTFREYVDNMNDLVDTTDANATSNDMVLDKTAYVNGQKITGQLRILENGDFNAPGEVTDLHAVDNKLNLRVYNNTAYQYVVRNGGKQTGGGFGGNIPYSTLASIFYVTPEKIKLGEIILGVTGTFTSDADATASDLALDKTAYVNGQKITGTLETATAVSIDNSNNTDTQIFLTNVSNIPSMVVNAEINDLYGVRKIVEDGVNLEITAPQSQIADVISLTADKIKKNVTIMGITGTYEGSGIDTSDATATATDLALNKTAYVDGQKITGTLESINSISNIDPTTSTYTEAVSVSVFNATTGNTGNVILPPNTTMQVAMDKTRLASALNLTADKIKLGETILGVTGTFNGIDTSDATAVTNDIVSGKTAYVNGQKLTGDLTTYASGEKFEQTISMTAAYDSATNMLLLGSNPGQCAFKGGTIELSCSGNTIATSANITANKIAMGETVLGIVGTYMGTAMKEYASVTAMNNDIANIGTDEVVKVVESGTTSYYIKEIIDNVPTMTKLVKESETMSPQEYSDANVIADNILGIND